MAQSIREVMTADPRTVEAGDTIADAAREMRDGDVGSIVVVDHGAVAGIITDRDIVVRVVADGTDPGSARVRDAATMSPVTLTVDQSVDDAIRTMRDQDIRRIVVVQDGRPPEERAAEDQSTNEIGFRDVDEEADHDEAPGAQTPSAPAPAEEPDR